MARSQQRPFAAQALDKSQIGMRFLAGTGYLGMLRRAQIASLQRLPQRLVLIWCRLTSFLRS